MSQPCGLILQADLSSVCLFAYFTLNSIETTLIFTTKQKQNNNKNSYRLLGLVNIYIKDPSVTGNIFINGMYSGV